MSDQIQVITIQQGTPGIAGSKILAGSGVPSDSLGGNGDEYVDVDTGDIYIKFSGAWGSSVGNIRGPQGIQGIQGPVGSQIYTGHGAPSSLQGVNGDFYLDVDNGDVYTKAAGVWGSPVGNITGPQGIQGIQGIPGSQILTGSGAPSGGTGVNTDLYIDTVTGDYYKKTGGIWNLQGNINANGLRIVGYWNATTNSPALADGVGTEGEAYLVSPGGTTSLDGLADWEQFDILYFSQGAWRKVAINQQKISEKSQPNGYASLDGTGKVPVAELPAAVLGDVKYQGTWNALTNSPALSNGGGGSGSQGFYYVVDTAGATPLDGISSWVVGDWVISNGAAWQKVDNNNLVQSVNGQQGVVALTTDDVPEGTAEYFTDTRAKTAVVDNAINSGVTDKAPSEDAVFTALAGKQPTGNYLTAVTGDVVATGPGSVAATIQPGAVDDGKVNAAAAIQRSKLASGNAYRIVANDVAGVQSEAGAIAGNKALASDANGLPVASSTSDTELGYVAGVTSAIQTQINGKEPTLPLSTNGDLLTIVASARARLGIGPNDGASILKRVSGLPAWEDWVEPSLETKLFEDWIADAVGTLRWLDGSASGGSSAADATIASQGHPGIIKLATGTTNGAIGARTLTGVTSGSTVTGFMLGGGPLTYEWQVYIPTLATVLDDYRIDLGLVAGSALTPDQVKFQYNRSANTNWVMVTQAASSTTTTDLGVAVVTGSWIKLKAVINSTGTSIDTYINGTFAATITTNIPTALIAPHLRIIKTSVSAVSSIFYADYFKLYRRFTTPR